MTLKPYTSNYKMTDKPAKSAKAMVGVFLILVFKSEKNFFERIFLKEFSAPILH
jgi:hypothetical protein